MLREETQRLGALLLFDEVMTGFRVARGGFQELCGITPDMTTLGKIIGGGFPVGAYGGRREIMQCVAPSGPVYQAGTLSGNPVAMTAGLATLRALNDESYARLETRGARLKLVCVLCCKKRECPRNCIALARCGRYFSRRAGHRFHLGQSQRYGGFRTLFSRHVRARRVFAAVAI